MRIFGYTRYRTAVKRNARRSSFTEMKARLVPKATHTLARENKLKSLVGLPTQIIFEETRAKTIIQMESFRGRSDSREIWDCRHHCRSAVYLEGV
jgi:hypothetical protein